MPRGNGTGPAGAGPKTGRGLGFCSGYGKPGYANSGSGRGLGLGFGRGNRVNRPARRGYRNISVAGSETADESINPASTEQQLKELKQQAEVLEKNLKTVINRIDQLEKE